MLRQRENIAPAPFGLAKLVRVWKAIFANVLVGRKVCPPYAINCQRIPPVQRFYATAMALAIVNQAGRARFWSKAAQHRFHADWRDRSFLELFGEWPSCWFTPRQPVKQALGCDTKLHE